MNLSSKGVLYVDCEDFEQIEELMEGRLSVADAFELLVVEQNIRLKKIEAVHFNPDYFYLSGQIIFALGKLRLKHHIVPV